jgi:hypothetical protein
MPPDRPIQHLGPAGRHILGRLINWAAGWIDPIEWNGPTALSPPRSRAVE